MFSPSRNMWDNMKSSFVYMADSTEMKYINCVFRIWLYTNIFVQVVLMAVNNNFMIKWVSKLLRVLNAVEVENTIILFLQFSIYFCIYFVYCFSPCLYNIQKSLSHFANFIYIIIFWNLCRIILFFLCFVYSTHIRLIYTEILYQTENIGL